MAVAAPVRGGARGSGAIIREEGEDAENRASRPVSQARSAVDALTSLSRRTRRADLERGEDMSLTSYPGSAILSP